MSATSDYNDQSSDNKVIVVFEGDLSNLSDAAQMSLYEHVKSFEKTRPNVKFAGVRLNTGFADKAEIPSEIKDMIDRSSRCTEDRISPLLHSFKTSNLTVENYFTSSGENSLFIIEITERNVMLNIYPNFGCFNKMAQGFVLEIPKNSFAVIFGFIDKISHQRIILSGVHSHNDLDLPKPDISLHVAHGIAIFRKYKMAQTGAYHLRYNDFQGRADYFQLHAKWNGPGEVYLKTILLTEYSVIKLYKDSEIYAEKLAPNTSVVLGNEMFNVNERSLSGAYCFLIYYSDKKFSLPNISDYVDSQSYVPKFKEDSGKWGVVPIWIIPEGKDFDQEQYFVEENKPESSSSTKKEKFDVNSWLKEIKMQDYKRDFDENDITKIKQLVMLTREDLNDIGVESVGHRMTFLHEISKLRKKYEYE